jgi:hypothetical protein
MGEADELAEEVLQLPADGPCDPDLQLRLGREIYDVLWNACDLARLTGIDVAAAAAEKRQVNENRTWPSRKAIRRRGVVCQLCRATSAIVCLSKLRSGCAAVSPPQAAGGLRRPVCGGLSICHALIVRSQTGSRSTGPQSRHPLRARPALPHRGAVGGRCPTSASKLRTGSVRPSGLRHPGRRGVRPARNATARLHARK